MSRALSTSSATPLPIAAERVKSREAAKLAGLPLYRFQRMARRGLVPSAAKMGSIYTFNIERLKQWIGGTKENPQKPRRPQPRRSVVYFVRSGDFIKIGRAINPKQRMRTLQVGSHLPIECLLEVDGGIETERAFHSRFARYWVRGEWFKCTGRLERFLYSQRRRW